MNRIHVTGCHRSGTTLMFELLTTCYQHSAHCEHENSIFNPLTEAESRGHLYIGKKPSDITHIHQIFRGDPNLYLIFMLRDPRDVITSIHPSRPLEYFTSFERWLRYFDASLSLRDHPRFLEIRYEDLVNNPVAVQKNLELKIPWLDKLHTFSEFKSFARSSEPASVSLGGIRPVGPDRIGRWRQHLPRIKFQLEQYPEITNLVTELGFEVDDNWQAELANVNVQRQDRGETRPNALKSLETSVRMRVKSYQYLRKLAPAAASKNND